MRTISPPEASHAHRMGRAVIEAEPDAEVEVRQLSHEFGFGATGFEAVPGYKNSPWDSHRQDLWLGLFNWATLPFYWGRFESAPGRTISAELRAAAEWFTARGVKVKGHPLTWHTGAPAWLADAPLDQVEARLRDRVRREVAGFAGLVDVWDAVNESVIAPVFKAERNAITRLTWAKGRLAVIGLAFGEAKAANPAATLLLNDFDLSSAYECLVEGALAAGVPVDALGLQTHMHQGFRGEEQLRGIVERFGRFGLPLHFTETTLVSGDLMPAEIVDLNDYQIPSWPSTAEGEARQADELVRHYRTLLAEPAVRAITYWDPFDADAWLGAPSGLVRLDGSPKPAYQALLGLVRGAWWVAPTTARADHCGRIAVNAWSGRYSAATPGGQAQEFEIVRGGSSVVRLGA
ncbi:MAG: endo-1,4-beta-xylanase [Bifidobacteriaceae bacterium]|jgi:GH35 family endo-1,4-beta-xylanase|nr:endo-1,4-beta-xylanase [Bifidobacteriaceae bacterium]